jgi:glycosyltransferase involved in cell wall biosynthesis
LLDSPEHCPLRVIHLVSSLATAAGGMARFVLASAQALAAGGAKVHVLSYENGQVDWPWGDVLPPNLEVSLFPAAGRFASGSLKARLRELLASQGTVLHLHGIWEPLTASAAHLARRARVPYVCSIHGMLDPWSVAQKALKKRIYYWLVERKVLARAAALHFTARQEEVKSGAWVPAGPRRLVIPVLMDLRPFQEPADRDAAHAFFPHISAAAPWILFLSRIHEKKGLDLLIEAVGMLADKRVQLVIAGEGAAEYVESMKNQVRDSGIVDRVHFVGLVQGAQKAALLRRADVLAIPSSQENFGIVFAEALASGTPVLVTDGVDIHEELVGSGGALLIRRDPADIAEKIAALLSDTAAARERGKAGRRWVFSNLAPEAIAAQWRNVYGEIAVRT